MIYKIKISDNNKYLKLKSGDEIKIILEENPTTGYRWQFLNLDKEIFQIVKDDYKMHGDGIGGGGVREFDLKVKSKGEALIELINTRDLKSEDSVGEFKIDVDSN